MSAAYEVRGVTCRLGGREIVHGVDLDVHHGEVLALVGPNGAGKSTLLGTLTGDVAVESGEVRLQGRPLAQWSPADLARARGVLLQANQVSFPFTVREVVEMGRSPWVGRTTAEQDDAAIAEAVDRTDIAHLLDRPFTALSGGEKARASLARVLAQQTDVVLLDEPTAALDLRHQEEVMVVARDLAAAGRAVIVVLHDLSLAAARADRIAMLAGGRMVSVGTPAEVLTPERVESVYGIAVHVLTDTPDGHLIVVPHRGLSDTVSS
ncbi:heme ABC transporter ATP-binding protein [Aeromicrobium duanguangcaii]|uniref:Heme ABC transporter ATP-binding protein n=1 Tax=Aeromicrobium duanguangcaii TaxID=2968086 RepID=A0ABY5KE27_9ACTN|nr:heme ABC transporter ATP-binding protein [Aeromicrobium duanguangcaii]MCD9155323.1 heme ABC transporter ATP-binding protein [Aeromicrobium duanguangcaii]MCL3838674.1 heme ABC transporter ATP-binding protein [Aeromicrobium duanguangcaii]UUI68028.1 heme ABC transporter ATP-binding protein [Aeromicrobium duanguangcaii]